MRILQVVQKPQRRGAEVFAGELSRALIDRGHDLTTTYLYPYEGDAPLPLAPDDLVLGHRDDHPAERLLGVQPTVLRALRRRIEAFGPDIVQGNGARTVKYAALAGRGRRRRWSLVYRNIGEPGAWLRGRRQRLFYRHLVMPEVDGVVAVSAATLEGVRQAHDPHVPVAQIPRSVDPGRLRPAATRSEVRRRLHTPEAAPVLVFVGSLTTEKRPDRLLRVFDLVRRSHPDAVLWVLGAGPAATSLEERLAEDGPDAGLRLLGVRDDVADHLHAADLLVLTSDSEGVPGTVLEAGALGRPVVATRVGGVTECVVDGETGLLARPDDEAGLARAIVELVRDPARRSELGAQAQRLVEERFSLAGAAESFEAFYERVRRP